MCKVLFLVLLAINASAQAQQVYKCVHGKQISYQSDPCEHGQAVKAWAAKPEPPPTYEQRIALQHKNQQQAAESAYLRQLAGRQAMTTGAAIPVTNTFNASQCEQAKATRKAALDNMGMKRTYNALSNLDAMVSRACK